MSTPIIVTLANISKKYYYIYSLKTFREYASAFYLCDMSFANIGNMISGLLSRIIISGFHHDLTAISLLICKIKSYTMQFFMLTSLTRICLLPIDQYLPTCARIQWRQWSNIKTAHHLTILFIIGWLLHGILYLIYFDLAPSPGMDETSCATTVVESSQAIKIHDVPCEKGPMIDSCGEKLGRTATNLKLCEAKKKENYAANLRINDILLKLISEQETTDNALLNEDDETFSNQGQ
ncbi:unnamed protein product [Rotaria socialis]|uniref:Uncharacterized protein n=1 Tax=Rotaria socialis TaxID=392032 RepID=A0A820IAM4_9BILA|nr:unnamed protein product [Rotaria socialis]